MQINITISQLLEIVGGTTTVNPNYFVSNIASLKNATPQDLAVVFDADEESIFDQVSLSDIKLTRAGIILASKQIAEDKHYLIVENPLEAYQKLIKYFNNKLVCEVNKTAVLDETVILEENVSIAVGVIIQKNARIGENTSIGAQCYIGVNVRIGSNVIIYPGVKILDGTIIGDNTIIHSGTVIGSDGFGYRISKIGLLKIPQIGKVRIGKDVEIGANCCIDRATFDETVIEDGVKIDNLVHIAHNVRVGAHTAIIAQTGIAGGVNIGMGCLIGGQVAIKDHVYIGNQVKIVSKSGILKDIKDGEVVAGVPAMPIGQWKRVKATEPYLPDILKMSKILEKRMSEKKGILQRLFGL